MPKNYETVIAQLQASNSLDLDELKLIIGEPDDWSEAQLNEIYLAAIRNNVAAISLIPSDKRKDELTFEALRINFDPVIRFLGEQLDINQLGYKSIWLILQHNEMALTVIDVSRFLPEQRTELYNQAFKLNPSAIVFVPENVRVEVYCQALKNNWRMLQAFPEMLEYQNNPALQDAMKNAIEECKKAIKVNWKEVEHIPSELLDLDEGLLKAVDDSCRQGVQTNATLLNLIPKKIRNEEIYVLAVKADAEALRYVPLDKRNYNTCIAAIQKDPDILRWIINPEDRPALSPQEYESLCQAAVNINKDALNWVHESVKNKFVEQGNNTVNLAEHPKEQKENSKSPTVIIAMDIHENDPSFEAWKALSAKDKIDKLVERIKRTCDELKNINPTSKWIIGFREYAISEKDTRHIDNDTRKYFKEKMAKLTKKYESNNLTIIGGTISTKKNYDPNNPQDQEKIKKIVGYYKQPASFAIIQQERGDFVAQLSEAGMGSNEAIAQARLRDKTSGGYIIRNTTYCFTHGKILGTPVDKMTPWFEINEKKGEVFQTQNKKGNSGYFETEDLSFGVDICRTHSFAVFKTKSLAEHKERPDLYFLLSDGQTLNPENIYGEYAVHIDSNSPTRLVCAVNGSKLHTPTDSISLYTVNTLSDELEIKGPFQAQQLQPTAKNETDTTTPILNTNAFEQTPSVATGQNVQVPAAESTSLKYNK